MRIKIQFELTELGDEIIAVPVGENMNEYNGVVRLNETASFIFKLMQNETSEEAIVQAMERKYKVAHEVLVKDVHKYIEDFRERGLLAE